MDQPSRRSRRLVNYHQGMKRAWCRYGTALLCVAIATGGRLLFLQGLGMRATFVTLYPAVMIAALLGGIGAGLFATFASILAADYFWLEPRGFGIETLGDWIALLIFTMGCVMISLIVNVMQRAKERALEAEARANLALVRQQELEAKGRLAAIVESSQDAIVSNGPDSIIHSWNAGAERMFGYEAGEMIGQSLQKLIPQEYAHEEELIVERVKRGDRIEHYETIRIAKDGRRLDVSLSISPLKDKEGRVIGASKIIRDITQRKRMEEELHKLNTELDQLVRFRTSELVAVNKELEAFSYSVAHDFRTPLRGISGFSQALLEDYAEKLDEEGQDFLRRIHAASKRMGQLIDDLLKLSRITRLEMRQQPVDLSVLVSEQIQELQQINPERQMRIKIAKGVMAMGDSTLLQAVISNLIENAWKFTANCKEGEIEFGVRNSDSPPSFFVRDNGTGFNMAKAGNLFEPFQRLHAQSDFPGTGIGLATVRRAVGRHGGRVWVEAEEGKGATFYFTLEQNKGKMETMERGEANDQKGFAGGG